MVVFLTLFLQLATGVHTIELEPSPGIAAIELHLDGERRALLTEPPWSAPIDLGPELAPHVLEAVAIDGQGRATARTRQLINLPRPRSQVDLLPRPRDGSISEVEVRWHSADQRSPSSWRFRFDGDELPVADPRLVTLPPHDPEIPHFLLAELGLSGGLVQQALTVGGPSVETISSQLTAVPVFLPAGNQPPSLAEAQSWLAVDGQALRVVSIERGPAEIVMVQSLAPPIRAQLTRLRRDLTDRRLRGPSAVPLPGSLEHADRLRVLLPVPVPGGGTEKLDLFPLTGDLAVPPRGPTSTGAARRQTATPEPPGLLRVLPLDHHVEMSATPETQRVCEAVSIAGQVAAASHRRRVVLLVTGPGEHLFCDVSPAAAGHYLDSLRVPLLVWSPNDDDAMHLAWGAVEPVDNTSRLQRAARRLRQLLDRQVLFWVEGLEPYQRVATTAAAHGSLDPMSEP